MSSLLTNARLARQSKSALDRILIVTGDYLDAKFWDSILNEKHAADGPKYWVEKGKKGNHVFRLRYPSQPLYAVPA